MQKAYWILAIIFMSLMLFYGIIMTIDSILLKIKIRKLNKDFEETLKKLDKQTEDAIIEIEVEKTKKPRKPRTKKTDLPKE